MGIQTIKTPNGEDMVVMPWREYLALRARAGDEEAEDALDVLLAEDARQEVSLSKEVSRSILDGSSLEGAVAAHETV